jgi:hypothetical protein
MPRPDATLAISWPSTENPPYRKNRRHPPQPRREGEKVLRSWPFPRGWLPLPGDGPVETDVVSGIRYLVGSKSHSDLHPPRTRAFPRWPPPSQRGQVGQDDGILRTAIYTPAPLGSIIVAARKNSHRIASHRIPIPIPIPPLEADRPDLSFGPRLMSERRCGRPSFLLLFFLLPFYLSHHFLSLSPCCRGCWIWYPVHAALGVLSRGSEMPFPPVSKALYVWTLNTRSLPKSYLEAPPSSILRLCGTS